MGPPEGEIDRGISLAGGPRSMSQGSAASVQLILSKDFKEQEKPRVRRNQVFPDAKPDENLNSPDLVRFENSLFAVLRNDQGYYLPAVRKVTDYWRTFLIQYFLDYTFENGEEYIDTEQYKIDQSLDRPELSS